MLLRLHYIFIDIFDDNIEPAKAEEDQEQVKSDLNETGKSYEKIRRLNKNSRKYKKPL